MKRLPLPLLAVLAAAAVTYLILDSLGGSERRSEGLAPVPAERDTTPAAPRSLARAEEPSPLPETAEPAVRSTEPEAAPVDRREVAPLPEGVIEGRVVIPSNAPPDPDLEVLAFAEAPSSRQVLARTEGEPPAGCLARAPVEADGRFRLALPADLDGAWLSARGRFLYALEPKHAERGGAPPLLRLRAGGVVRVQVRFPADCPPDPEGSDSLEAELSFLPDGFSFLDTDTSWAFSRTATPDDTATLEFRAVVPDQRYALRVEASGLAPFTREGVEVEPGQVLELEAPLIVGASLRGRVETPAGQPVAEAEVHGRGKALFGFSDRVEGHTKADGSFEIEGIPPGEFRWSARAAGYLESEPRSVELSDREVREGLVLVVEEGRRIAGRVLDERGQAVEGADVEVSFDPEALMTLRAMNAARGAEGSTTTAADGSFEVSGLGKGPFQVTARGPEDGGFARRTGIPPDTGDLELVLEPPARIVGRVEDPVGRPVEAFRVRALLPGPVAFVPSGTRTEDFETPDGSFALEGLEPGTWTLRVEAEGYGPSAALEVDVPRAEGLEPVVIALQLEAVVEGLVVDPSGAPVADARVSQNLEGPEAIQKLRGDLVLPEARTDQTGAFHLGGLGSGATDLIARAEGFAPSKPVRVEPLPGQVVGDLVLELRKGARLTGEVYDRDGQPAGGVQVFLQTPGTMDTLILRTEPDGTFEADNLRPGSCQVTAMLASGGGDVENPAAMLEHLRFTMVELEDGEETHVVLGAPPTNPVRLHGRVVHAQEPLEGALVSLTGEEGGLQGMKLASTDAEGRFEVELDGPGIYRLSVQVNEGLGGFSQQNVEFVEEIPEGEDHELELVLPTGRITGRVLSPDGEPLGGARVSLARGDGLDAGSVMGGHYAESVTDSDGGFSFDYLRPGVYELAAGGAFFGGAFGIEGEWGRVVQPGLRVEAGQALDGLELRLTEAARIQGRVLDATGQGVSGASVFVRDAQGRLLERFSMIQTDASGAFEVPGVAPGEVRVSARKGEQVSPESEWVRVPPGGTGQVELRLAPGAFLLVKLVDPEAEGEASPLALADVRLRVLDPEGHEVQGMLSLGELMSGFNGGFEINPTRFGPFPPGRYRVEATAPDGRHARRSLVIAPGETTRRVRLRLKD